MLQHFVIHNIPQLPQVLAWAADPHNRAAVITHTQGTQVTHCLVVEDPQWSHARSPLAMSQLHTAITAAVWPE